MLPHSTTIFTSNVSSTILRSTIDSAMADKESESKVPAKDIHQILQQLALAQAAPDSKKPAKKQEDYKFWNTQPVPKFQEPNLLQTTDGGAESLPEGPILPAKLCVASAKDTPEPLVDGFVWTDLDLNDNAEMNELYDLLFNHYVEDTDGSFRFNYSIPFLNWALKPPGWRKEWHVGVRTKTGEEGKKGKLVAFISAVPAKLDVRKNELEIVEINFLSIHRKLRAKRLTPVLIKEITRRCYRIGIYQALYTAGALLPTPVSTCRYFHRSLDWRHLYKNKFSALPPRTTEQQQIRKYFLTSTTSTKGLRPMKSSDVPAVSELLRRYLARFQLSQHFTNDELEHCLVSSAAKDVVWSYVVEDKGNITDFFSYYVLEVSCDLHVRGSQLTLASSLQY